MPHNWLIIAVGRVCTKCNEAQVNGKFENDSPCRDDKLDDEPQGANPKKPVEPPAIA